MTPFEYQRSLATACWCRDKQREFELLRDQYAEGSRSYQYNDGRAEVFRALAESAKALDPDLVLPCREVSQ